MSTQISTNNIETYISDLLDDHSSYRNTDQQQRISQAHRDSSEYQEPAVTEAAVLSDEGRYLSFAVAGSDFLIATSEVISVKSFVNEEGYRNYQLYNVNALLDIGRSMESRQSQFVLILRSEKDYAIRVDAIHGLVSVPADRLLIRKKIKDRPWYSAISRDFQSALLNSYMLGKSLRDA